MKVLAIDPGFGRCGVAVLRGEGSRAQLLYSHCIETEAKKDFSLRLLIIANEVTRLINEYQPDAVAIEEIYFTNNAKTAIHVAEIRGVLIYLAISHNIPIMEFNPLAIKVALTGEGRATKDQVIKMVGKIVTIPQKKMLDDEYDAIALGIAAIAESRHRGIHTLPLAEKV